MNQEQIIKKTDLEEDALERGVPRYCRLWGEDGEEESGEEFGLLCTHQPFHIQGMKRNTLNIILRIFRKRNFFFKLVLFELYRI